MAEQDFDPTAYLAEKAQRTQTQSIDTSGFDPSAYLESKGIKANVQVEPQEYTPAANVGRAIGTGVQNFNTGVQNVINKVPYPLNQTAQTLGGIVQDVGTGVSNVVRYPLEQTFRPANTLGSIADIAGNAAGAVGNVFGQTLGTVGNIINRVLPQSVQTAVNKIGNAATPQVVNDMMQGYNYLKQNEPEVAKNFDDLFNIASVLPATKLPIAGTPSVTAATSGLVNKGLQAAGSALEAAGEKGVIKDFASEALTKKQFLNKFSGATEPEKQANAANIIISNGLQKYVDKPEQLMAQAQSKVDDLLSQADKDLKNASQANLSVNPISNITSKMLNEDHTGLNIPMNPGEEADYKAAFDKIVNSPAISKFDKPMELADLPDLKQALNPKGDLFKKAAGDLPSQMSQEIRQRMYYDVIDQISDKAPEVQAANSQAKDLINVINASASAVAKANKTKVNFGAVVRDALMGGAGGFLLTHNPIHAAAIGLATPLLEQGVPALRQSVLSPSNLMSVGQAGQSLGSLNISLPRLMSNQAGYVPTAMQMPAYSLGALGQQQQQQ